jgi:Tfp pilus assembly protein PilF
MSLQAAQLLFKEGKLDEAEAAAMELLDSESHNPSLFLLLGTLCFKSRKGSLATNYLNRAVELDPKNFVAQFSLGRMYSDLGHQDKALEHYQKARELREDDYHVHLRMGASTQALGDYEQAESLFKRAVQLQPEAIEALNDLGVLMSHLGLYDEAKKYYRKVLELHPDVIQAHYNYAGLCKYTEDEPHLQELKSMADVEGASKHHKTLVNFSLGKAYNDIGDYDLAGKHFELGNRMRRSRYHYATEETADKMRKIAQLGLIPGEPAASRGRDLVFIIGMPRSGTTLTEQILGAHSLGRGIGETDHFGMYFRRQEKKSGVAFPEILTRIRDSARIRVAGEFEDFFRSGQSDRQVLIEKTPNNFAYLGLLQGWFPEAKFVHTVRDSRDVCFSIWSRLFPSAGHFYGYDAKELAEYYCLYQEQMEHWKKTLPIPIYDFYYERLVANPEVEVKALLEYCELPWEEQCLDFHSSSRPVQTASGAQVRQPIYQGSGEKWKNYETHLAPMLDILGRH